MEVRCHDENPTLALQPLPHDGGLPAWWSLPAAQPRVPHTPSDTETTMSVERI